MNALRPPRTPSPRRRGEHPLLAVGLAVMLGVMVGHVGLAAATVTIGVPELLIEEDGCFASSIPGPPYPDNGDTIRIGVNVTNNTGADAFFRVVFRVTAATGGSGGNLPVDLMFGGPAYMSTSGSGGPNWDDSFGVVVNTPKIANGTGIEANANFGIHTDQLAALGLAVNDTTTLTIRAEVFSDDFSIYYGENCTTLTVKRSERLQHKNGCPRFPLDAATAMLTTDKTRYLSTDTITLEWSPVGADSINRLPTWDEGASATVDIVRLDLAPSGDPEIDYQNNVVISGNPELTISSWTTESQANCTEPCAVTDEDLALSIDYSSEGALNGAETYQTSFSASSLTNNRVYLARIRPGSGGFFTIEQPQWTYFTVGDVIATPVTLSAFEAREAGGALHVEWETATEIGNVGFFLYVAGEGGRALLTDRLIPSRVVDSLTPTRYAITLPAPPEGPLYLEDVDLRNVRRLHGPFLRNHPAGRPHTAEPIDWPSLGREHRRKEAERTARAIGKWRRSRRLSGRAAATPHPFPSPPPVALEVDRDALYRVTYDDLRQAGFDLFGVPARALALLHGEEPVPIRLSSPGPFGPGAYFEFFGEGARSRYTETNVYRLVVDPKRARRIPSVPASPWQGTTIESTYRAHLVYHRDRGYSFSSPIGDPWYDTRFLAIGEPVSETFTFEIGDLAAQGEGATLFLQFWGASQWPILPDHHLRVALNGTPIHEGSFDGLTPYAVTVDLPAGRLREGENQLTVTVPGDTGAPWDLLYFDHFEVTFPRHLRAQGGQLTFEGMGAAFRVTGLPSPEIVLYRKRGGNVARLTGYTLERTSEGWRVTFRGGKSGATYTVASVETLPRPRIVPAVPPVPLTPGKADLLVISHPDFLDDLAPWIAARSAQGLSLRVADVSQVYARFSGGVVDPEAIRRMIAWAVENLGIDTVLLVGGDTYDYHDHLGLGSISFIPTFYVATDPIVRFTPSDTHFTLLDDDLVPDVAIGRLPVRSSEEARRLIGKILAFEAKGGARSALLIADEDDAGVSFRDASERFAATLPPEWTVERAYLEGGNVAEMRARILEAIEGGVTLTSFIGHSGPSVWSFQGLFSAEDAVALTNEGDPTVVAQWGCWNTYFVDPRANTMAHAFLLAGSQGAAAVLGAATLTSAAAEETLGETMMPLLVTNGMPLGQAVVAAKREIARTHPKMLDVLFGWTLLGDPTLSIDPR